MVKPFDPNSIRPPRRTPSNVYSAGRGYPRTPKNSYFGSTDPFDGLWLALGGIVIVFVVIMFGTYAYALTQTDTITCTVTDKDRARNSEGGSDARVYTEDCGTLRVADSIFDGTWSSADTYASIEPGNSYTFDTRGMRVPFFSMFPNIVKVYE